MLYTDYFGNNSQLVHISENVERNPTIVSDVFFQPVPTINMLPSSAPLVPTTVLPTLQHSSFSSRIGVANGLIHSYSGKIIYKPSESGLGNNLLGLTSAFIIAAVTNKRLFSVLYCNT